MATVNDDVVKGEASAVETRTVKFGGLEYEVPADAQDWPVAAILAYEEEKPVTFLKHLLGGKQFGSFLATWPRLRDYAAFMEAVNDGVELEPGN